MKSITLKTLRLLLVAIVVVSATKIASAQDAQRAGTTPSTTTTTTVKDDGDKEFKNDYRTKMNKFDDQYNKLKKKEASTNDPEMKADLNRMLQKMDAVKADMDRYQANGGNMTEEQKKQAKANIQNQMNDIKQMHEAARTKYGKSEKSGEKADKQKTKETNKDTESKNADKQKAQQEKRATEKKEKTTEDANPK